MLLVIVILSMILVVALEFFLISQKHAASSQSSNYVSGNQVAAENQIAPGPQNITISDNGFMPSQLIVNVGDTVTWINSGSMWHTVTSSSGSELESPEIAPGDNYSHTFDTSGIFDYYCSINPSMIGEIIVQ